MVVHHQACADLAVGSTQVCTASNDESNYRLQHQQAHNPTESSKRRAPYVQQACHACRKRKGRCDGRQPCAYCEGRFHECVYSNPLEQLPISGTDRPLLGDALNTVVLEPSSGPVTGTVATAKGHLDTVAVHPQASTDTSAAAQTADKDKPPYSSVRTSITAEFPRSPKRRINRFRARSQSRYPTAGSSSATSSSRNTNTSQRSQRRLYHGPTSPGYSFLAVWRQFAEKTRSNSVVTPNLISTPQHAAPEFNESDSDESSILSATNHISTAKMVTPYSHPILYQALDLLGEHECTRLLGVYHQALGELHPICSVDHLKDEACRLQGATNIPDGCQEGNGHDAFEAEENDLLTLNIALAIALTAEAASEPNAATTIYESCRDLVIAKVARTASSVKDVVVTMMMGFYYYFRGKRRLAWRMCSLAGRMAMELGLHCDNVAQQNHETEEQETQLVTLSCTLLILDRQWSAGIGLPSNFKETDFDMAQVSRVSTPYLREMMKFTLISHKFNEPISRVARGEALDEAKIEIIDFQVMQWRKRAMESHNYIHPDKWEALSPQNLPPAWMTILYLRANAVRTILIRAFFLSEVDGHVAAEKVALGLDLISESLNILSILDRKTDAYKLLHPVFQHFVASSCALLLLIIFFVRQNPNALPAESAATYAHQVHRNFEIALKLSAAYQHSSRESRKLWHYLQAIGEPLFIWGLLQDPALRQHIPRLSSTEPGENGHLSRLKKRTTLSVASRTQTRPEHDKAYTDGLVQQREQLQQKNLQPRYSNTAATTQCTVYDAPSIAGDICSQQSLESSQLPTSSWWGLDVFDPCITGWSMGAEGPLFSDGILGGQT